jgi:hypothetical protein
MKRHEAARSRPEHLARQHHARAARFGHAPEIRERAVRDGAHVEPDDLRSGDLEGRRLRRRDPHAHGEGQGRRGSLLRPGDRRPDAAADIFKPIHERTNGVDGYVSLELSPTIAFDTKASIAEAKALWARAARRNLFIKIPGTPEGLPAIEESIFAGCRST